MDYGQVKSWIDSANPQDLTNAGKHILTRIGTLPQDQRDRFFSDVKADPTVARLLETA